MMERSIGETMGKKKVLLTNIAPDRCEISKLNTRCEISKLNTRQTYDGDGTIVELAEEMKLHGFEPTRALWGYSEEKDEKDGNYKYEIFAVGRQQRKCVMTGSLRSQR
jgi:hypothetical protein